VLPGIVYVENNLVDDVLWTDETLNVFKNFPPKKKRFEISDWFPSVDFQKFIYFIN